MGVVSTVRRMVISIKVAALAEATSRAHRVTGDVARLKAVDLCASWILGSSDVGPRINDHSTGGCANGPPANSASRNQGAESTLTELPTDERGPLIPQRLRRGGRQVLARHGSQSATLTGTTVVNATTCDSARTTTPTHRRDDAGGSRAARRSR